MEFRSSCRTPIPLHVRDLHPMTPYVWELIANHPWKLQEQVSDVKKIEICGDRTI